MKAASVAELKQELLAESPARLTEICLRLARFKKENKELLTYLLFEAHHPEEYIASVKAEMDEAFAAINSSSVYYIKKSLRKILRIANKYIRYCGLPAAEVEILLHFCRLFADTGVDRSQYPVLENLWRNQLKRIKKTLDSLHEDLQYEYKRTLKELTT